MDPWLVVRRQINMPSERRTEPDDRFAAGEGQQTHRCTHLSKKTKQNNNYPISLHTDIVTFESLYQDKSCCLCGQQNLLPNLELDLTWFRTDYNLVYVLLESVTGKQGWSQCKQRSVIWFFWGNKKGSPLVSTGHFCQHSSPTWPFDYYSKINLSIYQKTNRVQSKYYLNLNTNWLKWVCDQSCQWQKNNGSCNVCNTMKTAITTCNITVSPQSQKGARISVMYWPNNQKLMG